MRRELCYFRDQQRVEVEVLLPRPRGRLWLIEAKASKTIHPQSTSSLFSIQKGLRNNPAHLLVVHRKSHSAHTTSAITKGVEALHLEQFSALLSVKLK
ncbi:MAG: hypothetical protein WA789_02175 [Candidatus Acidiferrum sp.]